MVNQVNLNTYKVGFSNKQDFEIVSSLQWERFGKLFALIRKWMLEASITENTLGSLPIWIDRSNVPENLIGHEAISRLSSHLYTHYRIPDF